LIEPVHGRYHAINSPPIQCITIQAFNIKFYNNINIINISTDYIIMKMPAKYIRIPFGICSSKTMTYDECQETTAGHFAIREKQQ
jgi:hypothetical protein